MRKAITTAAISLCLAAISVFPLTLTGCGPRRGDLAGKVSYQGRTLASGSVLVAGSDGVKSSPIAADGTYRMTGIPAGEVKISVSSPDPGIVTPPARNLQTPPPPPKDNSKWFPIPDDYSDFRKSGLTYELKAGSNRWDIDLK